MRKKPKRLCVIHNKEMTLNLTSFGDTWDDGKKMEVYRCDVKECKYVLEIRYE